MDPETKIVHTFSSTWCAWIEASALRLMVWIVSVLIHYLLIGTAAKPVVINAITRTAGNRSRTGIQLTRHHIVGNPSRTGTQLTGHHRVGTLSRTGTQLTGHHRVGNPSRTGTQLTGHHDRLSLSSNYALKMLRIGEMRREATKLRYLIN